MSTSESPNLNRVLTADTCSGCGLCAGMFSDKIAMTETDAGYLRPVLHARLSAEEEAIFAETCPGSLVEQDGTDGESHVLWGPTVSVHTGYATDQALRYNGSSGGVLSAVAVHLLSTGSVDGVVQVQASVESPTRNITTLNTTAEAVFNAASSRYAPSAPLSEIEKLLSQSGRFAFIGKPCDVAALRALQRRDKRARERFPYVLSFFCAGIPSTRGAKRVLQALGLEEAEVEAFRYRGEGWPGTVSARTKDGRVARMGYTESWGGILSKHVQFRCKICPDGSGGMADLVCADAWTCDEQGYPLFEEQDGRSLVIARTVQGQALLDSCVELGAIKLEPLDIEEIARFQPSQARRKKELLARMLAMPFVGRRPPTYSGFNIVEAARSENPVVLTKAFFRTLRGLIRPRQ